MRRLIVSAFLCLAFEIGFTVCAWADVDDRIYPTAISIPESIEIDRNDVRTIRPVLTPINAETDLDFFSQDSSIAEFLPAGMGDTGNVVGINAGETILTVTTDNGLSASCNVKVNYRPDPESITIPTEYTLNKNDFWDIPISLFPQDSTARYDIESDNEIVASTATTGSNNGVRVHGEAPGTATITVRTFSGLEATCLVTVIDAPDPESISIPERHEMFEGESWNVPISLTPEGVKTQFSITTSDSRVTRVTTTGAYNGCRVYAGITGSAEITIATKNGLEAKCLVTVLSNQNDGDSPSQIDDKDQIYYIDENGLAQEPISEYEIINSETTEINDSWVIVNKSVNNTNRLTVNGNVNLLLCDGVTLNLPKGIAVTENNSLTIYGQSAGTGTIIIDKPENNAAGIGGNWNAPCGTICICGGTIKTQGAAFAAGIGGGGGRRTNYSGDASGGTIIIKGGMVTASGGDGNGGAGAGIGGGYKGSGGVINISGGKISADGGLGGAGIGGGYYSSGGKITISGGTIDARGNGTGAGIGGGIEGYGGVINITGGSVTASGSGTGSSIGAGSDAEGGIINITGGKVVAGAIGSSEYGEDEATIALGWTEADDHIQATKYRGTVSIADGKHLMDGSNSSIHFDGADVDRKLLSNIILVPDLREYYQIAVATSAHGSLTASLLDAPEGDMIKLIATPDDDYELMSVTITDTTGMSVDCSDMQFVMPANNVSVRATFAKADISGAWGDNITWTLDGEGLLSINGSGEMLDFGDHDESSAWRSYINDIKSVQIGFGVTRVGNSAFRQCCSLKSVKLPSTLRHIGNQAFSLCNNLPAISLPEGLIEIDFLAFGYCSSLQDVFIPSSVECLGAQAFAFSENLQSVILGSGLKELGIGSFRMCRKLNSIKVDDRNEVFRDIEGVLYDKQAATVVYFPNGRSGTYLIPNGVTSIGDSAFALSEKLESVIIPKSVQRIGRDAFQFCKLLRSVSISSSLSWIGEGAFSYCNCLTEVHYDGPLALWNKVNIGANNDDLINAELYYLLPDFILPVSIMIIEEEAFSGGKFTYAQLPDNALSIGPNAFTDCQNLEYVIIPSSVSDIDNSSFDTGITIIGVYGSHAYTYAQENNIIFIPIE